MVTPVEAVAVLVAAFMGGIVARVAVPTRRTILAAGPWTVTGALAVVASRAGAYETIVVDVSPLAVTATVAALAAASWAGCIELAALRGVPYRDRYLAATGAITATVLGGTLLFHLDVAAVRLVWVAIPPIAAGVLAAVGYFVLGLVYTDTISELRIAGLYTLGAVVLDGTASAVVVERLGGAKTGVLTTALLWVAGNLGVDASIWALLPAHLFVGMVFVAGCGWASRYRHEAGLLVALLGSVAFLWAGSVLLLSAILLG